MKLVEDLMKLVHFQLNNTKFNEICSMCAPSMGIRVLCLRKGQLTIPLDPLNGKTNQKERLKKP